jgi:hypothetical protein
VGCHLCGDEDGAEPPPTVESSDSGATPAVTISGDDVSLVGDIVWEDPSAVVLVSIFWSGRGWVSCGVLVVVVGSGHESLLLSLSGVVVLMEDPSAVVLVSTVWSGRGWVSCSVLVVVVAGRCC